MSGPTIIQSNGDGFNGGTFNSVPINGYGGIGVLYLIPPIDSEVFELFIGGKLRLKEKFCGIKNAPNPAGKPSERLVPVCRQVKP